MLLKKLCFAPDKDKLFILGDLIDRGQDPCLVCDYLMKLQEQMDTRLVIIRGNHEQMAIDSAKGLQYIRLWHLNGSKTTIESFLKRGIEFKIMREWFKTFPLYHEDDDFTLAHAGARWGIPMEKQDINVLIWNRDLSLLSSWHGKPLIVGHTPVKDVVRSDGMHDSFEILKENEIYKLCDMGGIIIDTGCVFGYKLSAMIIDEKGNLEVKSVHLGEEPETN